MSAPQPRTPPSIARFVIGFFVWLGLMQLAFYLWFAPSAAFEAYLHLHARAAEALLKLLGYGVEAAGATISGKSFSVEVKRGCDGIQPVTIFAATVLAFPATWRARLLGLSIGALLLQALNVVRVSSLYWIGARFPRRFEFAHVTGWPVVMILLALLLWAAWAHRIAPAPPAGAGADAS